MKTYTIKKNKYTNNKLYKSKLHKSKLHKSKLRKKTRKRVSLKKGGYNPATILHPSYNIKPEAHIKYIHKTC